MDHLTGLTELLSRLDTRAHFGRALPAINGQSSAEEADQELVLVTCRDAWTDPDFQRHLAGAALGDYFAILVERDGQLTVSKHTAAGQSVLKRATLDVASLLQPRNPSKPAARPVVDSSREHVLPAIFHAKPFPLYLSYPVHPTHSWRVEGRGVYTIAADGRLLLWTDAQFGARQLATGLRTGRILCCRRNQTDETVAIVFGSWSANGMRTITLDENDTIVSDHRLDIGAIANPNAVEIHNGVALAFNQAHVAAVSLATGEFLGSVHIGAPRTQFGRFFLKLDRRFPWKGVWIACSWDGQKIATQPLPLAIRDERDRRNSRGGPIAAFSVDGSDAPTLLFADGTILHQDKWIATPWRTAVKLPLTISKISRDGHRLLISAADSTTRNVVAWQEEDADLLAAHDLDETGNLRRFAKSLSFWRRSRSLYFDHENLWISSGSDRPYLIHRDFLRLTGPHSPSVSAQKRLWMSVQHPDLGGIRLSKVAFKDGSIIYFDSRGLLHFRSSDAGIPEFSILAAQGYAAGWSADGWVWGARYFIGSELGAGEPTGLADRGLKLASSLEARDELFRPFLERLR